MKKKKKTNENKHKQTTKKQNKKGLFTYQYAGRQLLTYEKK